eukprot:Rmarinus@m.7260
MIGGAKNKLAAALERLKKTSKSQVLSKKRLQPSETKSESTGNQAKSLSRKRGINDISGGRPDDDAGLSAVSTKDTRPIAVPTKAPPPTGPKSNPGVGILGNAPHVTPTSVPAVSGPTPFPGPSISTGPRLLSRPPHPGWHGPGRHSHGPGVPLHPPPAKPPAKEKEVDDSLDALLEERSVKEREKIAATDELLMLLNEKTAKEEAAAARCKTKGGTTLREFCKHLTRERCRWNSGGLLCSKIHFRQILQEHTDMSLGDCSYLDTCRHMATCKFIHYELDFDAENELEKQRRERAVHLSEVKANMTPPQWLCCDLRALNFDILGKFDVVMADPPWDIHMDLPYGTMGDDEMRNLKVPQLVENGLLFLWVTGRCVVLGNECLELWGFKKVDELIWVKTNQLQRLIRTGRTGHWLNHSKEHCLVGLKGTPRLAGRRIDCDVLVAEVRETSRKPDEIYDVIERLIPGGRKIELFGRMHNTHAGWITLGNQLKGSFIVDEQCHKLYQSIYGCPLMTEETMHPEMVPKFFAFMDEKEQRRQRQLEEKQKTQPNAEPLVPGRATQPPPPTLPLPGPTVHLVAHTQPPAAHGVHPDRGLVSR